MPPGTTVPSSEYSVQIRFRASANVEDYAAPRTRSSILAVLSRAAGLGEVPPGSSELEVTPASVNLLGSLPVGSLVAAREATAAFSSAVASKEELNALFVAEGLPWLRAETEPIIVTVVSDGTASARDDALSSGGEPHPAAWIAPLVATFARRAAPRRLLVHQVPRLAPAITRLR